MTLIGESALLKKVFAEREVLAKIPLGESFVVREIFTGSSFPPLRSIFQHFFPSALDQIQKI